MKTNNKIETTAKRCIALTLSRREFFLSVRPWAQIKAHGVPVHVLPSVRLGSWTLTTDPKFHHFSASPPVPLWPTTPACHLKLCRRFPRVCLLRRWTQSGHFPHSGPVTYFMVPRGSLVCVMFTSLPVTWSRRQTASCGPGAGPFLPRPNSAPNSDVLKSPACLHGGAFTCALFSHSISTWFASSFSFHTMNDIHHQAVSVNKF